MNNGTLPAVDYLAIGHLARDLSAPDNLSPPTSRLGGAVAYAALTAARLGWRAGLLTAVGPDVSLAPIEHLPRVGIWASRTTTFENRNSAAGRLQTLHHQAPPLTPDLIPPAWRTAPIVHLAPIVHELSPAFLDHFPASFIGLTPQGWLRQWDRRGRISPAGWPEYSRILPRVHAAVLSLEDVGGDEDQIAAMAAVCPLLVVTEGSRGARLFVHGLPTPIPTTPLPETDPTGAGDIFAAAFFTHLHRSGDPLEAAHFATRLAARSVTRAGLAGVPTQSEAAAYALTTSKPLI